MTEQHRPHYSSRPRRSQRSVRPVARDLQAPPGSGTAMPQLGSKGGRITLTVISSIILVACMIGYIIMGTVGDQVSSAGGLELGTGEEFPDGAVDILLVGSDSRTDVHGNPLSEEELASFNAGDDEGVYNTDTIILIRVPQDGASATAVSIPRDTYVHDEQFGNMKINGVAATYKLAAAERLSEQGITDATRIERESIHAGRNGLVKAVADLTGVEVDHYAEVGLLGFVLLTDAIGGVEVCLNAPVQDEFSGANFPAGRQTLSGTEALSFVRQRHGLPRGDLDRVARQQAYMASMVNKLLSTGTVAKPTRIKELGEAVQRSVIIDDGWDIVSFAMQMQNLAAGNVRFSTIPVTSVDGVGDYGESIITVDPEEVHEFMDRLSRGENPTAAAEPGATPPQATTLRVLNAGTIDGLAADVSEWLRLSGRNVVDADNAQPGIYQFSQVVAGTENDPEALALAEELGGLPVTRDDSLEPGSIVVVTADDYMGPRSVPEASPQGSRTDATIPVGQPGADFGAAEVPDAFDAGEPGGPHCVN